MPLQVQAVSPAKRNFCQVNAACQPSRRALAARPRGRGSRRRGPSGAKEIEKARSNFEGSYLGCFNQVPSVKIEMTMETNVGINEFIRHLALFRK